MPAHAQGTPAAASDVAGTQPASLDDYFDRLDAAISPEGGAAPRTARPGTDLSAEFGSWDIGLDEQLRSAPGDTLAPSQADGTAAARQFAPSSPEPSAAADEAPLADAFAALLAAEQHVALPGPAVPPAAALTDEAMDEIVRRVLARMTDTAVRAIVLDVAERLVREEIERIKNPQ
jgi:hypothetical protein